jgi:hypothetical protein
MAAVRRFDPTARHARCARLPHQRANIAAKLGLAFLSATGCVGEYQLGLRPLVRSCHPQQSHPKRHENVKPPISGLPKQQVKRKQNPSQMLLLKEAAEQAAGAAEAVAAEAVVAEAA